MQCHKLNWKNGWAPGHNKSRSLAEHLSFNCGLPRMAGLSLSFPNQEQKWTLMLSISKNIWWNLWYHHNQEVITTSNGSNQWPSPPVNYSRGHSQSLSSIIHPLYIVFFPMPFLLTQFESILHPRLLQFCLNLLETL